MLKSEIRIERNFTEMLTLDKIYHAAFVLKDVVRHTELIRAPKLNAECELY